MDTCPYCQRPILDESGELYLDEYHVRHIQTELERERQKNPQPAFWDNHPVYTQRIMKVLFTWLYALNNRFVQGMGLTRKIYFLAVNYTLRYLEKIPTVPIGKLQLIGMTALWIAGKYEEYGPRLVDLEYLADYKYTKNEFLFVERDMIAKLHTLSYPSPEDFLHEITSPDVINPHVTSYLLAANSYFIDRESLSIVPSLQAVAAMYIACKIVNRPFNPASLLGHTMESVHQAARIIVRNVLSDAQNRTDIYKVHNSPRNIAAEVARLLSTVEL